MPSKTLDAVISTFGHSVSKKLSSPAISGAPEDQLRSPLEILILDGIVELLGYPKGAVVMIGETSLAETLTRPDYAVTFGKALTGFIEVKAPGKGADPRRFQGHDKEQWNRLKSLPNLLYTDGMSFSLWRDGELQGSILRLEGDLEKDGKAVKAPGELLGLFSDFFTWTPETPKSPRRLAEVSARLCRLLRDEVTEQLDRGTLALTGLAEDWRKLLFPQADNAQFADGYAQAVTFGLLIARTRDIPLADGIDHAASDLKKSNSLIGTALGLLTDNPDNRATLKTSLDTMTRVLDAVNWQEVGKNDPDAWLYFYEHFLEVYDNNLRKRTGSYYTPPEVVNAMVRMVDEVLRGPLFERPAGFASQDVTVADPAVGTGTFLLGVLRRIAETVASDMGDGAVPSAITSASERLIGFELQFGPFAVAQLRLIAELQELMRVGPGKSTALPSLKLFITNTLGNPFEEEEWLPQMMQPIANSRRQANAIKRGQPITVVIGNPPYKEKAEGRGGWVESGAGGELKAPMDWWRPPVEWGVSAHTKHLKNLYIYFWRWATWKVFGTGNYAATGRPDKDEEGIVCFITVAGFLNGPGFSKMRDDLRRTCSNIWVIDCSPEGHQPEVATRIFQGVQQPVCIVVAAKKLGKDRNKPADVRYTTLPAGKREGKFEALTNLSLDCGDWIECSDGWRDPFLPEAVGSWAEMPPLKSLFIYDGSGVMPGRTWVIAPDRQSLAERWQRLTSEKDIILKEQLFHPHLRGGAPGDKHIRKDLRKGLRGHQERLSPIVSDNEEVIPPTRYGYRFLDRQWIIPDARLINQSNPALWDGYSNEQVFLTALDAHSPTAGPALTFTDLIPDLHHYKGSFGGRVMPLWRDASASQSNIRPDLLALLADIYGKVVTPTDIMAYLAAVMAHRAFTAHFLDDLVQPGLRVPLTADASLFFEAVALGREGVWLHSYGERFTDAAAGRPKGPPRLPSADAPRIPADGAIPGAPEPLPNNMEYDPANHRLTVGKGYIDNVPQGVWEYEVSGKQVLWQWFSYRKFDRSRPIIGDRRPPSPLDRIQPDHWLPEYTADLMNLLHVLGRLVMLEPGQADLLNRILEKPLLGLEALGLKQDNANDSSKVSADL
ncbi:N-6 DNA methylase [Rhizobium leguminosarum]|uniref:type ISP restriction/modification enzyme n=1 Tax=Rhizobium leguminosarum TaxID=384 RepID=UPI0021BBF416|nr:type ISP restriction/modification enzyme [Rhizobium leguminosarum]MBY5385333.1 N-6 DNA methylase [Rhizobium leguminosarum]MBY5788102.1 N-6 DNA methylase [Rhizobium leguminosarum]